MIRLYGLFVVVVVVVCVCVRESVFSNCRVPLGCDCVSVLVNDTLMNIWQDRPTLVLGHGPVTSN